VKGDQRVPDPLRTLLGDAVAVHEDNHIEGLCRPARRLIDMMQLDRPAYVARRRLLQRIPIAISTWKARLDQSAPVPAAHEDK